MTGTAAAKKKPAAKKRKSRAAPPGVKVIKQQLAKERVRGDQLNQKVENMGDQISELSGMVKGLVQTLQQKEEKPAPGITGDHVRKDNEQLADKVLGRDKLEENLPEHPEQEDNGSTEQFEVFDPLAGKKSRAADYPVAGGANSGMESEEQHIGQHEPRRMESTGDAREALAPLQVADEAAQGIQIISPDKAAALAFNEEMVCVMVHDTGDDTETPMPLITVNGVNQYFQRGRKQWVKRKFVERLARLKHTNYTQIKDKDENGDVTYINIPHTNLLYPFQMLADRHPRGHAWLEHVLAEV